MAEVSVIIPCYNHGHYLTDAVNSVLVQSYTDWEVIIVDDGSTDNTREVALQFGDPRIRYIHQENRGLSGARNTGLSAARGTLIALLDADDVWNPAFLERMLAALRSCPTASAAYCGFQWMDADGNPLMQTVQRVVAPEEFRDTLLRDGNWLIPCSVVTRASAYRKIGQFDETLRACEDFDMWLRLSKQHHFVGVSGVLVRYRRTGKNMSDDVERMRVAMTQVLRKCFGALSSPVETWPEEKRSAVSQIYLMGTQEHLAQGNASASAEAFLWLHRYRRDVAFSLDLWYALACVHQEKGTRGDFASWRPTRSEADLAALQQELQNTGIPVAEERRLCSLACFCLSLLHYGQRDLGSARCRFRAAVLAWPGWWRRQRTWALLLRLLPGVEVAQRYART